MAKKKIPKKKEKITEIFEVKKEGKEKKVIKKGITEVPVEKPGQKKHQAKIFRGFLIITISLLALIIGLYSYGDSLNHLNYEGVPFETISEGDLIFYQTSIPVVYQSKIVPYNFYLRTKPRKLEEIPFNRTGFELTKLSVINITNEFNCDGYGVIAVANLVNLYNAIGSKLIIDNNISCDPNGEYTYYNLMKGDNTEINKVGKNCYNVKISNCEVLPATEKIMAEIFLKLSN